MSSGFPGVLFHLLLPTFSLLLLIPQSISPRSRPPSDPTSIPSARVPCGYNQLCAGDRPQIPLILHHTLHHHRRQRQQQQQRISASWRTVAGCPLGPCASRPCPARPQPSQQRQQRGRGHSRALLQGKPHKQTRGLDPSDPFGLRRARGAHGFVARSARDASQTTASAINLRTAGLLCARPCSGRLITPTLSLRCTP